MSSKLWEVQPDERRLIKSKRQNPKNAKTPAQKLGLVDNKFSIKDIIEHSPAREFIKQKNQMASQEFHQLAF